MKGEDDPVTEVNSSLIQTDFKIQTMLIKGFKMYFPELKIIGEETEDFKGTTLMHRKEIQSMTIN